MSKNLKRLAQFIRQNFDHFEISFIARSEYYLEFFVIINLNLNNPGSTLDKRYLGHILTFEHNYPRFKIG